MDLRAKLDKLRSMEPPAALFEPPPWAALSDSPLSAATRERQLRDAVDERRLEQEPAPSERCDAARADRPDLRRKLARLRSMNPPASPLMAAERAEVLVAGDACGLQLQAAWDAAPAEQHLPTPEEALTGEQAERKARLRVAVRALQESQARFASEPAMPVRARLERVAESASAEQPAKSERIARLRSLIAGVAARDRLRAPSQPAEPREHGPPPWLQESTEHGPLHVCTRYLEPDHHHGHSPVGAALYERPGALSSLVCDPEYTGLDLSRALYLDTETTGLAGGTGTVAFLVGLARFEDASLCVEQLVVPQLGSETPVLARLAERLATASCLVTYNGKSFDWPLLRTRFVLARLPVPPVPPHIDLLHVCRRVWKERLPSVRLVDMEREVLRFEREDDLPGSEIPARYFEFLRGGSPERLCPVLEHNQNDLIALAALLGAVMEQYTGERTLCSPTDALHYGKLALRARDLDRARNFGQDALTHSNCQRQARAALVLCAEIEHKLGRIPEAIAHLECALDHAQQLSTDARSELDALAEANLHFTLAKLYEHEQHDLVRALRHARKTELVEGPRLHGRRLGRLVRRLLRSAADAKPA